MTDARSVSLDVLDSYDWREVFASAGIEQGSGNTGGTPKAVPGSSASEEPFAISDVVEIIAHEVGENDGPSWVCVVRLKDGRYAALEGSCDYTGWDCHAGATCAVATTEAEIIAFGIGEQDRARLGLVLDFCTEHQDCMSHAEMGRACLARQKAEATK